MSDGAVGPASMTFLWVPARVLLGDVRSVHRKVPSSHSGTMGLPSLVVR